MSTSSRECNNVLRSCDGVIFSRAQRHLENPTLYHSDERAVFGKRIEVRTKKRGNKESEESKA